MARDKHLCPMNGKRMRAMGALKAMGCDFLSKHHNGKYCHKGNKYGEKVFHWVTFHELE